jgi:hypothetical protein
MNIKLNWDSLGIATSLVCAIHCMLLPLLFTSLPFFGINIIHNNVFEWAMIAIAFMVGIYALVHGYIKHHKNIMPVLFFGVGFMFLVAKQFFAVFEVWFVIPAVGFIIFAHYKNYLLCKKSKCASPHHTH